MELPGLFFSILTGKMVLPTDFILPDLISFTAAIRWNWVSIKKCQAVSNTEVYESNYQNTVTELSDFEKNCICMHMQRA